MQEKRIYQLIFEHSVQGMVLHQGEKIILVNQSFSDMVGYSIDEMLAFSFEDALNLIHPVDREWVLARFKDRLAGKDVPEYHEYRFVNRHGETRWWSATVSVIEYGGQPAVLGTYLDITEHKQANEAVRREWQLLADILNVLPIGVCLNDETGHYRLANDAYYRIYDFEPGEILGQHYTAIMPPAQIELANQHFARLLEGDLAIPVERIRKRKDGSIIHIEAANALVKSNDDQKMVITAVRDISERKEMELALQASAEQFRTLFDEAPTAMLLVTERNEVRLANRQAEILFGYDEGSFHDVSLDQLFPPRDRKKHHQHIQSFFQSKPQTPPLTMARELGTNGLRCDGTQFPADIMLEFIHLKDEALALAFVFDATERLELEHQRLELHLEQERSKILVNFMHNAAHEFRTPLTVIENSISLLDKVSTVEQKKKYNERIRSQIDALARLVSQLVFLSQLTYIEEIKAESVELNSLLMGVVVNYQAKCADKQISVQTTSDYEMIQLAGDPDDLAVAFSEILDNAIKFSPDGGQIQVDLTLEENSRVLVKIQDKGVGMTPETQRRALERFYREDKAHSTRGFGLGLTIAKRVFELHGGSVTIASTYDKGTIVQVYLPYISL